MHLPHPVARQSLTPLQNLIIRRWRPQWLCSSRQQHAPQWLRCNTTSTKPKVLTESQRKKGYYTTPIFYATAQPHIGHAYSMLLADVLKRWDLLKGREAIMLTGTDEHGLKVQQAAAKLDMEPQALCDQNADKFRDLASALGVENDIFMRTTDSKHREAVEYAWQMLSQRGYIYESKHEGWYSVSDETFYAPSQVHLVIDPPTGRKIMASIETGKEVEWSSEVNYRFRLSAFRDRLLELYKKKDNWITPRSRMDEVIKEVTDGLEDLSISRPSSRLTWGVRVPDDSSQTIYVWLDALLNYVSAIGYPFQPDKHLAAGWPADVQIIGKDIVRFHCIYWPAFLLALDLPVPRRILTHAHWTLGSQKMAKSTGNVVNPFFAIDRFGKDGLRWYLLYQGGIQDDAKYDNADIEVKYKKQLLGGVGNLINRVIKYDGWNVRQSVQRFAPLMQQATQNLLAKRPRNDVTPNVLLTENDKQHHYSFVGNLTKLVKSVPQQMFELYPNKALLEAQDLIQKANSYITTVAPWSIRSRIEMIGSDMTGQSLHDLSKQGITVEEMEEEIEKCIFFIAEALRLYGIMVQAFVPDSAKRLLDMLGVEESRRNLEYFSIGKDDSYGKPFQEAEEIKQLFPSLIATK